MKKVIILFLMLLTLISYVSAECILTPSLINQDPYPAIPGEYVKLVFQLDGVSDASCGELSFNIDPVYPFYLDPETPSNSIQSGTYVKDYKSHWIIPYKLRVDEAALDGLANLTIEYSQSNGNYRKNFEIEIENPLNEFEVKVSDYSYETKQLTLEVLNLGEKNVDALVLEIPSQENALTYGSNYIIIGALESEEDERVSLYADVEDGPISVVLKYNDENSIRRIVETNTYFDSNLFSREVETNDSNFSFSSFIYGIIFILISFYGIRYYKNRKNKNKSQKLR